MNYIRLTPRLLLACAVLPSPWLHAQEKHVWFKVASAYEQNSQKKAAVDPTSLAESMFLIADRSFDPQSPNIEQSFRTLAENYAKRGNYLKALDLYHKALPLYETRYGREHTKVAELLLKLAENYAALGKIDEAEVHLRRAIKIRETIRDISDPELARVTTYLANIHASAERYAKAEDLYNTLLRAKRAVMGPTHPEVAELYMQLADLLTLAGEIDKAKEYAQIVLTMKEKGNNPLEVGATTLQLGYFFQQLGDQEQADLFYERGLSALDAAFRNPDVKTARPVADTAEYELSDEVLNPELAKSAELLLNRARVYVQLKMHGDAIAAFEQSLELHKKLYRGSNEKTALLLGEYAQTLTAVGDNQRAAEMQALADKMHAGLKQSVPQGTGLP